MMLPGGEQQKLIRLIYLWNKNWFRKEMNWISAQFQTDCNQTVGVAADVKMFLKIHVIEKEGGEAQYSDGILGWMITAASWFYRI